jgi:hypothetical protein
MAATGTSQDKLDGDLTGDDDDRLTDGDLELEIELVSQLVLAATSSDRPLRQDEVDHLLGLDQPKRPEM